MQKDNQKSCFYSVFRIETGFYLRLFLLHLVFKTLFVKLGVEGVEVFAVELVGEDAKVLAEALIVYNLALTQEADSVLDVGVITEAQDVVVCRPSFLFRRQILVEVGYGVAL